MSQRLNSTESSMKNEIPDYYDEEETSNEVKTRSCCGCVFFMLVMWIWISLAVALPLDELVVRPIALAPSKKEVNLICGWRARRFSNDQDLPVTEPYASEPALSESQRAGQLFFGMVFCVAPFATALMLSCCMRTGSKDEEQPYDMDPKTREKWRAVQANQKKWNIGSRVIGFLGTFAFEIGAYFAFRGAFGNCSSALKNGAFTTRGDAVMGRTFFLLLSAMAVTLILVIIIIALIVILTSENAEQLALVAGLGSAMNICCDTGCPECAGGLDCCGDPTDINGEAVGGDALCCCCGGGD